MQFSGVDMRDCTYGGPGGGQDGEHTGQVTLALVVIGVNFAENAT